MEIAFVPRWVLAKLTQDRAAQAHLNVLVSTTLVLATILALSHDPSFAARVPHLCLSSRLLGIPCPGCGMTGALVAIPAGTLALSYQRHPAAIPFFVLCLLQISLRTLIIAGRSEPGNLVLALRGLGSAVLFATLIAWSMKLLCL